MSTGRLIVSDGALVATTTVVLRHVFHRFSFDRSPRIILGPSHSLSRGGHGLVKQYLFGFGSLRCRQGLTELSLSATSATVVVSTGSGTRPPTVSDGAYTGTSTDRHDDVLPFADRPEPSMFRSRSRCVAARRRLAVDS